jgi:uncharacterized protein (DUF3820 family)
MSKRLTDNDPIDFGKYKGKALGNGDVPASYLLYCYRKGMITPSVRNYVRVNYDVLLKQEQDEKNKSTSTDNR